MAATELLNEISANIERVIVGKRDTVDLMLVALLCEGHVLVEDVPGTGKTTLCKALARSVGCTFRRIQFTPDVLPSDVTGIYFFSQRTSEFEFRPGPIFANLVLADEINRATPRTQSAMLESMEERHVTVEGDSYPSPRPFMVIATQNPVELEGTFPLPEAQLDRFLLKVTLGYPNESQENEIVVRFGSQNPLEDLSPVVTTEQVLELQRSVHEVHLDPSVRAYAVQIVRATRSHPAVQLGASPRATRALCGASQARALLEGRSFTVPDDVKAMALPVLGHRLILDPQHRIRGRKPAAVIEEILRSVPVPVEERSPAAR